MQTVLESTNQTDETMGTTEEQFTFPIDWSRLGDARDYQKRIIVKACNYLPIHESVAIESPTGSGKTYMALRVAEQMTLQNPELITIMVAAHRNLLTQSEREIENFGVKGLNYFTQSMFDETKLAMHAAHCAGKKVLMIFDENQHAAAASMIHIAETIKPDYMLGLSATPYRADKAQLGFRKQIRDASIHRLIGEGYLSRYDLHIVKEWTPEHICKIYAEQAQKWGKSIFYMLRMEQAEELQLRLEQAGYPTTVIRGGMPIKELDEVLEDFDSGKIMRIINCMMLTEGYNCSSLETVFVRDGSKGPTTQMAGRVLRLHPNFPIKNVVQSANTKYPFTRKAKPRCQFTFKDDAWVSLTPNQNIDEIARRTVKLSLMSNSRMPDFILKKQSGKKTSNPRSGDQGTQISLDQNIADD